MPTFLTDKGSSTPGNDSHSGSTTTVRRKEERFSWLLHLFFSCYFGPFSLCLLFIAIIQCTRSHLWKIGTGITRGLEVLEVGNIGGSNVSPSSPLQPPRVMSKLEFQFIIIESGKYWDSVTSSRPRGEGVAYFAPPLCVFLENRGLIWLIYPSRRDGGKIHEISEYHNWFGIISRRGWKRGYLTLGGVTGGKKSCSPWYSYIHHRWDAMRMLENVLPKPYLAYKPEPTSDSGCNWTLEMGKLSSIL